MHLVFAQVVAIFEEEGMRFGKIRVAGAMKKVPLELLASVQCGDTVLLCDGMAISKETAPEANDVPSDPRQTA